MSCGCVNISDILYADYDLEDNNKMFAYIPDSQTMYYFTGEEWNESHEPVIIYDDKTGKSYLVKFDI